ncbi:MAG: hypothetical protein ACI8QC_002008 [Planctomycetota bacterium]|jgi:hypothetical protein
MNTTSTTQRLPWILCGMLCMALLGSLLPPAIAQDGGDQETDDPRYLPTPAGGNADSNQDMIAVTGVDLTGTSVLYLVDTRTKQLVVYQASGGGKSTQGVRLVGARNISLDLRLDGFNDKTESGGRPLSYKQLEEQFASKGLDMDD